MLYVARLLFNARHSLEVLPQRLTSFVDVAIGNEPTTATNAALPRIKSRRTRRRRILVPVRFWRHEAAR
jgi:hypothetical protein